MPVYVYETISEDPNVPIRRFEVSQRLADEPLKTDPETGLPVRRIIAGGTAVIGSSSPGSSNAPSPRPHHCCGGGCKH